MRPSRGNGAALACAVVGGLALLAGPFQAFRLSYRRVAATPGHAAHRVAFYRDAFQVHGLTPGFGWAWIAISAALLLAVAAMLIANRTSTLLSYAVAVLPVAALGLTIVWMLSEHWPDKHRYGLGPLACAIGATIAASGFLWHGLTLRDEPLPSGTAEPLFEVLARAKQGSPAPTPAPTSGSEGS